MAGVEQLVQQWRHDATLLRQYENQQADWLEDRATELETALKQQDTDLLNLTEAARMSGYTAGHIGRLVRSGALQNFGHPHAPKVRRADLPKKLVLPGRQADPRLLGASREQVAKAITTSGSRR